MSGVVHGKTGVSTKTFFLFDKIKDCRRFLMIAYSLYQYDTTKVAKFRLKVIEFFEEFGLEATKKAFGVSKSTVYRWRKRLKESKGRLSSLISKSTRPKRTRRMITDYRIVEFIKKTREEHPRLGKKKIKPLLDEYCQKMGISSISESTIGKVIKRNNFFFQKSGRIYHDPNSGWAKRKRKKRIRIKYPHKYQQPGHLHIDSITLIF